MFGIDVVNKSCSCQKRGKLFLTCQRINVMCGTGRKLYGKNGSVTVVTGNPDIAVVKLDQLAADGQPQTGALRLGGKERGKYLLQNL
jgi:hypothetical protein